MLFDQQLMFSEAQDISQDAGTYLSTNVIDLGAAGSDALGKTVIQNLGLGEPTYLWVQMNAALAATGAATLNIQLVAADDAALSSNAAVLASTGVTAKTAFVAGYKPPALNIPLPNTTQRYLGLKYVIADDTTTAGTVTAGIVKDRQSNPTPL